jgi:5-methyltetrahydropteroyltriglutamate--homocysteine methyltransferase
VTALPTFATQLVGSWCKPRWLADHDLVYGPEGSWWRVPPELRDEALDDAVLLAIDDQARAGLTFQTDGECRRQTFSGHFYAFGGIDQVDRGAVTDFSNDVADYLTMKARPAPAPEADAPPPVFTQPRVVGPLTWEGPILDGATRFLRDHATGRTKVTVIGPTSLGLRLVDEHYGDPAALTFALAEVIGAELRHLESLGVDLIQLDEPEVHFRYSQCEAFAAEAIDRALAGLSTRTAVHVCYGYSKNIAEKRETPVFAKALDLLASTCVDEISLEYEQPGHQPTLLDHLGDKAAILGVLNLDTDAPVETVDHIVGRARDAVSVVGPDRLRLAPDCGMWFLPRATATAKISAMEAAARSLREEFA